MTDSQHRPSHRSAVVAGCVAALALSALAPAAETAAKSNDLVAEVHAAQPLTGGAARTVFYDLRNRASAPRGLQVTEVDFQPAYLGVLRTAARASTALPNPTDAEFDAAFDLAIEPARIRVSGAGASGVVPEWPMRDPIALLPGEGYARSFTFAPGWLPAAEVPRITGDRLIMYACHLLVLAEPEPGSVGAGKPLRLAPSVPVFDDRTTAYVPFHADGPAAVTPAAEAPATAGPMLSALVVLPSGAVPASGLVATYLIGNTGSKALWLWQDSLVPALATWDISVGAQHAVLDGSAVPEQPAALPLRAPLLLNPGEYLSFQRVVPVDLLPVGQPAAAGGTLGLRINASWLPLVADADDPLNRAPVVPSVAPQVMALSAQAALPGR